MSSTTKALPTLRRAALLMTFSSFLVPAAGVVTAPVLARALSADGRGELAAAMAPAALMLAAATLGLPDALTYHLAKRPHYTRPALAWASAITLALGFVCFAATYFALSFLSAGNHGLGQLILLATALTIPALVVNVLRGAAMGRQMWTAVAVERVIITTARVLGFGLLFLDGRLTLIAAVLMNVITPIVAGIVYWPLFRRPPAQEDLGPLDAPGDEEDGQGGELGRILKFGSQVWLGSVASMLLSRAAQLLMTPLSSATELGLYSVASTISDLPLVVALAIQGALFGVNSKARDAAQITATSRLTLFVAVVGCVVLGGTLPFWITPLFGREFAPALVPTLLLLGSALICIPGLMAATGLSAWGRPGLRSIGLAVTLVANVAVFVLLVPRYGVYGACWTSVASNVVMGGFMIAMCTRTIGVPATDFFAIRRTDVHRAWNEGMRLLRRLRPAGTPTT